MRKPDKLAESHVKLKLIERKIKISIVFNNKSFNIKVHLKRSNIF